MKKNSLKQNFLFIILIIFFYSSIKADKINSDLIYQKKFDSEVFDWQIKKCNNFSFISIGEQSFIKIGPDSIHSPQLISPKIKIELKKSKDVFIKFKCSGYINAIQITDGNNRKLAWFNILAKISYEEPLELCYIIPFDSIKNIQNIQIAFLGFNEQLHDSNEYFLIANFSIGQTNVKDIKLPIDFRRGSGINYISNNSGFRYTWLTNNFNRKEVEKDIQIIKKFGNTVRLWCSVDNLSIFDSTGIWKEFNEYITNLDTIFLLMSLNKIKVIPTIFSQYSWSGNSFVKKIITDSIVFQSYVNMCEKFVKRYSGNYCIIGWDICNESLNTTLTDGLKGKKRMFAYETARNFMEVVYQKIKKIDKKHPIIATFSSPFTSWALLKPDKFADIIGFSTYLNISDSNLVFYETSNSLNFTFYKKSLKLPFFISEIGAPVIYEGKNIVHTYRDEEKNANYLKRFFDQVDISKNRLNLLWRDGDVLWDRKTKKIKNDGIKFNYILNKISDKSEKK